MHSQDKRESHWLKTLEVAASLKNRPATEPAAAPQAGEVYLCRRTADFPVEWLVVEAERDLLRLVPVDDYPLVGSRDVELASASIHNVAVARCGYSDWAGTHLLEAELRTRIVGEDDLALVRSKLGAVDDGRVTPVLLEEVVDGDPEYQQWCEGTLASAGAALTAVEAPPESVWRRGLRQHWRPLLAVAALLVVALGLGMFTVLLSQQLSATQARLAELEEQAPEQRALVAEQARLLEAAADEKSRLSERLSTREAGLATAQSKLAEVAHQLEKTRREWLQAAGSGAVANVRKLVFGAAQRITRGSHPDPDRGPAVVVQAGSSAQLYFEVEVLDPEPYMTYRVHLASKTGEEVSVSELDRNGTWLRFSLPTQQLPVGDYQIRIHGTGFGEDKMLAERYRLVVEP